MDIDNFENSALLVLMPFAIASIATKNDVKSILSRVKLTSPLMSGYRPSFTKFLLFLNLNYCKKRNMQDDYDRKHYIVLMRKSCIS